MNEITEIIEKAKELGKLISETEQVKSLAAAKSAYEQDKDIQELLGQFNLHKISMAALSKQENPDEERINDHEEKLKEVYDKIMQSELMTQYQIKSQAVEQLLGQVNNIINFYVSGEAPGGCSGNCSSCGGCN